MQCDRSRKDKEKDIEINVAFLAIQLGEMEIKPPREGIKVHDMYVMNNSNLKLKEMIPGED